MLSLPLETPLIGGHYYSFASIETRIAGIAITDFTAINYSSSMDVSDVYGTRSQKLGTTRGKQNAEGTLEMYVRAWEQLRALLRAPGFGSGQGYTDVRFPIIVTYAEDGSPTKTDVLDGCRIVKVDYSNSEGTDASKVSLTLNVMRILEGREGVIAAAIGIPF